MVSSPCAVYLAMVATSTQKHQVLFTPPGFWERRQTALKKNKLKNIFCYFRKNNATNNFNVFWEVGSHWIQFRVGLFFELFQADNSFLTINPWNTKSWNILVILTGSEQIRPEGFKSQCANRLPFHLSSSHISPNNSFYSIQLFFLWVLSACSTFQDHLSHSSYKNNNPSTATKCWALNARWNGSVKWERL